MITLAIITIIASISIPSYERYMTKGHRLQAENCLAQLSVALEHYFIENQTYAGATIKRLPVDMTNLDSSYQLQLITDDATHYTLKAEPVNQQVENDAACGTLSLNETGERMISGSASLKDCW